MKTKRQFFARPALKKLAPSGLRTGAPGLPAPAWTARRRGAGAGSACAAACKASAIHKVLSKSGAAKSVEAISS